MRAVEYIIQEHSLFSEKCFHLFVNVFHIFDLAESPRNHRLVRDNDSESSRLVDLPDRVNCTIFQCKVLFLVYKAFILVDRAVPVHKDTTLFVFETFSRNHTALNICQCLIYAVHSADILYVLRRAISIDRLPRLQHALNHIILKVPFHRLRHIITDLLFKYKNSCVYTVLIPVIPHIVLGIKRRDLIILIEHKKIRIKRMSIRMYKQCRDRTLFFMEVDHSLKINIKEQISGHHDKPIPVDHIL